ncbi:TPA: phage portal protein, partial [Klebsiella variicola subsp. variicola]|nr:phage portal protein [Klebsiella variicola subsp. variicola]
LNGKDGRDGIDGKDGAPGLNGKDGRDGIDGKDGAPGMHGKDAMQIQILPAIELEKSYARGTYATHEGGLWRAFEETHEKRGWECIVDGLKAIEVEQSDDLRTFTIKAMSAAGRLTEKAFSVPVMIYRDVFSNGKAYEPGDAVTWGGSIWHCYEPTTDKPGEPHSKGWRLAVKKGRDAK